MSRHLIANLDWEHQLARAAHRGPRGPGPLPARVLATVSTAAALLRVFLGDDDTLWTPAGVDSTRLPPVPGLAQPDLAVGAPARVAPDDTVLAWGETAHSAALRHATAPTPAPTPPLAEDAGLVPQLWSSARANPDVAARVQHRAHTLGLARELNCALPGATLARDIATLLAALPPGPWVLKAPWSAAGRERIIGTGQSVDDATRTRMDTLLARHGELIVEPWQERVEDLGVAGLITDDDVRLLGVHRQHVDASGRFLALTVRDATDDDDDAALLAVATRAGEALAAAGLRGPFGIDAWRARDAAGTVTLHPLGEINARLTFGHVAHAYREWSGAPAAELVVSPRRAPTTGTRIPLVLDEAGAPAAWLCT